MGHLRSVEARNVVASNVMMSNAPKMTCPGDPRVQTHTQIVRAYLSDGKSKCKHARGRSEVRWQTSRYRSCRREGAFFRECRGI